MVGTANASLGCWLFRSQGHKQNLSSGQSRRWPLVRCTGPSWNLFLTPLLPPPPSPQPPPTLQQIVFDPHTCTDRLLLHPPPVWWAKKLHLYPNLTVFLTIYTLTALRRTIGVVSPCPREFGPLVTTTFRSGHPSWESLLHPDLLASLRPWLSQTPSEYYKAREHFPFFHVLWRTESSSPIIC